MRLVATQETGVRIPLRTLITGETMTIILFKEDILPSSQNKKIEKLTINDFYIGEFCTETENKIDACHRANVILYKEGHKTKILKGSK